MLFLHHFIIHNSAAWLTNIWYVPIWWWIQIRKRSISFRDRIVRSELLYTYISVMIFIDDELELLSIGVELFSS